MSYSNESKSTGQRIFRDSSPVLLNFKNTLFAYCHDPDYNSVVIRSTDGSSWSAPIVTSYTFVGVPALGVLNGVLYCAVYVRDSSGFITFAKSTDGTSFGDVLKTSLTIGEYSSPALATMNMDGVETMFCAYKDPDSNLTIASTTDGVNWIPVKTGQQIQDSPALSVLNGKLVCTFAISSDTPYLWTITSFDGQNWDVHQNTKWIGNFIATTTVNWGGVESLICAYPAHDNPNILYVMSTTDGIQWRNFFPSSETGVACYGLPGLASINGKLVFALKGLHIPEWCYDNPNGGEFSREVALERYYSVSDRREYGLDFFEVTQRTNTLQPVQHKEGFDLQFLNRDFVDFHIDSNLDIHGIFKSGTASGTLEVMTLSKSSNYTQCTKQTKVPLELADGDWTFFLAENLDLYGIRKSKTGTGKLEVHALSAHSDYQSFILQKGTPLPYPNEGDQFLLAPNRDIIQIGQDHHIKILTSESAYQALKYADQKQWLNGDEDFGNAPVQYHMDYDHNIYGLQMNGVNQYEVKLYGFAPTGHYSSMKVGAVQFPVMTSLPAGGLDQHLLFDKNMDLHIIDTNPHGNAFMTHRKLSSASGYQTGASPSNIAFLESQVNVTLRGAAITKYQKAASENIAATSTLDTPFSKTVYPQFKLKQGEIAFFHGADYSGSCWKISKIAEGTLIQGTDLGDFVPVNEISSVKLGPDTGVSITPFGKTASEDYFADTNFLDGVGSFKVMSVESATQAGIGYSVLLTEDYRYKDGKLEPFKAYQTILRLAPGIDSVTVYTEKQTSIYCGPHAYQTDDVKGQAFNVSEGSDSLVLSVEATAIGTTALKVRTNDMKPDTYVAIFPDQQVHHRIATLPDNSIYQHRDHLKITHLDKDQCEHVQKAIQNMVKAARFPDKDSRYSQKGQMEHAHWQVAFGDAGATYSSLTPEQSQAILNNSKEIQAGGAHGLFSFISHACHAVTHMVAHTVTQVAHTVEHVASDAVHKVEHLASDLIHDAEHVASDAVHDAEHVVHKVVHVVETAAQKAEDAASDALHTLGVAHLVHAAEGGTEGLAGEAFHGLKDVAHDTIKVVKVTVKFADHAVTIVADHTGLVGHLIGTILHKVGAGIDDVLNFLSDGFDWPEIVRIKDAINSGVDSAISYAGQHSSGIQTQGDQFLDSIKSDIKSVINILEPLGSMPASKGQSVISPAMAHKILWFLSKYQEYSEGFPYPKLNLFGDNPGTKTSAKLEAMEQKLLAMGIEDIGQVLSQLETTISQMASHPDNPIDTLIQGVLGIAEDIADDGVDAVKLIFDTMMELYQEQLANMPSVLNQNFPVPFFKDLSNLIDVSVITYADIIGFAIAIPAEVYEKEKGVKLFANSITLSNDGAFDMTVGNSIVSAIGGYVAAQQAMQAKPGNPDAAPEVKSLEYINFGISVYYQVFRYPGWYIPTSDKGHGPAMFMWSYQWAMLVFRAFTLKKVKDGIDLRIFNAAGQWVRLFLIIMVINPPNSSKRLETACVPLPGMIAPLPKLAGASVPVKVGTAVAQGVIAGTYETLIWVNE